MRISHASLVRTFEAWCELMRMAAEEKAAREQRALAMAARWLSPYLSMTFIAWVEFVQRCTAIKTRAAYAIGPGRMISMAMRTWACVPCQHLESSRAGSLVNHHH